MMARTVGDQPGGFTSVGMGGRDDSGKSILQPEND